MLESITRVLGKQGNRSVIPDILALLKDKQEENYIRKEVTRSFVSLGDKSVIQIFWLYSRISKRISMFGET